MTINDLIKIFGIKDPTDKIKKHPKVIQILDYCNNHDVILYRHHFYTLEKNFIILIENLNSIETLLKMLKKSVILLNIDFDAYEMAKFYNIYDPNILSYNEDTEILMDEEYLKYTTKEWTENVFFNQKKILTISKNRIYLRRNTISEDSENYIESYLLNLVKLKEAKELGLLKEAIIKLSK